MDLSILNAVFQVDLV